MKWTLKLSRIYGIDVRMHAGFALPVGWLALIFGARARIWQPLPLVCFLFLLFVCAVLHEFGHALAARRYGIKTRDIILLPIGGVARLERMPTNPLHELWVALAGPAVNIAIASVLFIWLKLTASLEPLQTLTLGTGTFLERIRQTVLISLNVNSARQSEHLLKPKLFLRKCQS